MAIKDVHGLCPQEKRIITQFDGKKWIKIEPKWVKGYRPATRYVQL